MTIPDRKFPATRLRRTRMHAWSRALVQETILSTHNLIWPVFIIEGNKKQEEIQTMPGVSRISIDILVQETQHAASLGIKAIALFPVVPQNLKSESAQEALNPDNLICRAIRALKTAKIDIGIITDVALDPYTSHGHDGIIIDNEVHNDTTIEILAKQALVQAQAGADIIAPSDMQDGRIAIIRNTLEQNKFHNTMILSYAAKYASNFYGPFRDAVGSAANLSKQSKDSYQQDYNNANEALHEVAADIAEGADMIMIKPALAYLDIIQSVKQEFKMPTMAYQVSGEYSMLELLAKQSNSDSLKLHLEALTAIRRAGADAIFTYAAIKIAKSMQ